MTRDGPRAGGHGAREREIFKRDAHPRGRRAFALCCFAPPAVKHDGIAGVEAGETALVQVARTKTPAHTPVAPGHVQPKVSLLGTTTDSAQEASWPTDVDVEQEHRVAESAPASATQQASQTSHVSPSPETNHPGVVREQALVRLSRSSEVADDSVSSTGVGAAPHGDTPAHTLPEAQAAVPVTPTESHESQHMQDTQQQSRSAPLPPLAPSSGVAGDRSRVNVPGPLGSFKRLLSQGMRGTSSAPVPSSSTAGVGPTRRLQASLSARSAVSTAAPQSLAASISLSAAVENDSFLNSSWSRTGSGGNLLNASMHRLASCEDMVGIGITGEGRAPSAASLVARSGTSSATQVAHTVTDAPMRQFAQAFIKALLGAHAQWGSWPEVAEVLAEDCEMVTHDDQAFKGRTAVIRRLNKGMELFLKMIGVDHSASHDATALAGPSTDRTAALGTGMTQKVGKVEASFAVEIINPRRMHKTSSTPGGRVGSMTSGMSSATGKHDSSIVVVTYTFKAGLRKFKMQDRAKVRDGRILRLRRLRL